MTRPLIGISAGNHREPPLRDWMYNTTDYFRSVQHAGGIPVLLPFVENESQAAEVLDRIDGLLLTGGEDLDPQIYGEQPHPKLGLVVPDRDFSDLALARAAMARSMPLLGICRGHQVLAVAMGGTLIQDIPAQVPGSIKHRQDGPRWFASHSVTAEPGSRIEALLGREFRVNTFHHQSVKAIPPGWLATASAPDGVNEALEHPGFPFALSVQWHPENFVGKGYNFDALFAAFVQASRP